MKFLRKKMFRVLLMAAVVFTAVSFAGSAAPADVHAAYYNDYTYTVKNGNAIITGYKGTDTDLTLPETINGHPVTGIGKNAFTECSSLTRATIPYSVKSIGNSAFADCTKLTIYGEYNSVAQAYAKNRNIPFVVAVLTRAKLSSTKYVYNGKARKPSVKVPGLVYNTDFTVSYANNVKAGKATVTIKGKGIHSGTLKKTFKIVPKKAAIAKLKPGKASLTVKASTKPSVKGASAYQIAYKQKGTSKWRYTKTKDQTKTISSLKKGQRYYVKVRAYRMVSNVKYRGAWSKIKLSSKIR